MNNNFDVAIVGLGPAGLKFLNLAIAKGKPIFIEKSILDCCNASIMLPTSSNSLFFALRKKT